MSYKQDVKNESREFLIKNAIEALTIKRKESYCVQKDRLVKITNHFNSLFYTYLGDNELEIKNRYSCLFQAKREEWLTFYNKICLPKPPESLKVLYLSGPEPLNDIEVFLKYGINLSNIWALEADKSNYDMALKSLTSAGYYIKLHKGTLQEFFEQTNHEFDIIYYDACSPLISSSFNPLETLKQIFINKRLTGLSVLITNFAEPKANPNWGDIMAPWFACRSEMEMPEIDSSCDLDSFEKSICLKDYSGFINENLHEYYDRFLTHFIACFASEMIPIFQVLSMKSIQNKYFLNEDELKKVITTIKENKESGESIEEFFKTVGHFKLAVDTYPLLNWVRLSNETLHPDHQIIRFIKSTRNNQKTTFEMAMYLGSLLKNYEDNNSGYKTFISNICNKDLIKILDNLDFFDRKMRLTCDTPMKNLLAELFIGLYGFPYLANINKIKAIKYKAKETWMFSNIFVFDQCRYLFDFMPSFDLFEDFFKDIPNQVIIRGCIDVIRRHQTGLNNSIFKWGYIEAIDEKRFGKHRLGNRINFNEHFNV